MKGKSIKKGLLKSFRLYPTLFYVDVWVCNNNERISEMFSEMYGASKDYYYDHFNENGRIRDYCTSIIATKESKLKGEQRLIVVLQSFDKSVITHEAHHVLCLLSDITGVELGIKAQEWGAYMVEYIYSQCIDIDSFSVYE